MKTITKKEIVDDIAARLSLPRVAVRNTVQRFLDRVLEELGRRNRLEFRDFGVFEVRVRRARPARNPRTSESVQVPPRCRVKFKPGRLLKKKLAKLPTEAGDASAASPAADSR